MSTLPHLADTLARQRIVRAHEKRVRRKLRGNPDIRWRRDDSCPQCGSGLVIEGPITETGPIDMCMKCTALWEREERAEPELECCSKCAFQPGSPEQADPVEWKKIVDNTVRTHGVFLCHKRVPLSLRENGAYDYKHRDASGAVVYGTRCHGWTRARCAVLLREVST